MGFWLVVILWAATFAVSQLLTPKPEFEDAKAATLDEFNFPTTTEGRMMPLGWGTDKFDGPNVLWYGDLRTIAITQKVKSGFFSSKRVVVGHQYYVGFQLGICLGPAALRKIWIGDELVWSGNKDTDGDISINHKDAKGTFAFFTGSKTQSVSPYLDQFQSPTPAYRGLCYGVFERGYIGDNQQVRPWAFEVTRIPTDLATDHPTVNSYDCNLMEMAYELLTSSDFGYGYPDSDINLTEFRAVAETLYTEGNGISYTLNRQTPIPKVLKLIEKQADCRFRIDPQTGQWRVVLARDGYSLPGLRALDKNNILEIIDFSRAAWDQTVNSVRISYKRRANNYGTSYAPAQDGANMRIQNRVVPATWTFEGVKDDALANKITWRELRSHSYPLSKGRFKVNRDFWDAYEGEVVVLNYTIKNVVITDMAMRITRIDVGNKEEPNIMVDVVQDIFSWRAASFADPDASSWVAPDKDLTPFPSDEQIAFEVPYAISRRELYPSEGRIWCSGVGQNREETGFRIRQRNAVGSPAGDFFDAGDSAGMMFIGTIDSLIDHDDGTIDVLTDLNITEFFETTAWGVGNDLTNLFLIEDEFVGCTGVSAITGGLRLTGCYRGLLDSAQDDHIETAPVYLINVGGTTTDTAFITTNNVHLRLLPFDFHGNMISELDVGLTQIELTMSNREKRPYTPTFLSVNGTDWNPGTISMDASHGATEDDKGFNIGWTRRDFRIYDEVSQNHTDANTIDPTFPAANTTEYAIEIINDPLGSPTSLFTTTWQSTAADHAFRTPILRYTDGVIPTMLKILVKTRHTYDAVVYESHQCLCYDFATASAELAGDFNLGALENQDVSNSWTAPDTGSYDFTMGHANTTGFIQARINGGSWSNVILVNQTSGTLAGVTVGDTIEVRTNTSLTLSGVTETILRINSPSSAEDAYAIFVDP